MCAQKSRNPAKPNPESLLTCSALLPVLHVSCSLRAHLTTGAVTCAALLSAVLHGRSCCWMPPPLVVKAWWRSPTVPVMDSPEINLALSSHIAQSGWQGRSNPPDTYLSQSSWDEVSAGDSFSYFAQSISKWVSFIWSDRLRRPPFGSSMEIKRNEMWCLLWSQTKAFMALHFGLFSHLRGTAEGHLSVIPLSWIHLERGKGFSPLFFHKNSFSSWKTCGMCRIWLAGEPQGFRAP